MNEWIEDDGFGPMPAQPGERPFLKELDAPLHRDAVRWGRTTPRAGELALTDGLRLDLRFPDPGGRLATAYRDFRRFLASAGIPARGCCTLRLVHQPVKVFETYSIEVRPDGIIIRAGDTEGVRRALICLEDEIRRAGGPFLATQTITRTPVVRTRIGLHVLMSTPDKSAFFSDAYLNRLAHDGVNGLMLPLFDIYPGRLVPEFEQDPEPMFGQLRQYVQRYARHGIRLFPYVLEPGAFPAGDALRRKYPDLVGGDAQGLNYYCPSTPRGRACITRAFQTFFAAVPGLGGLISICVGERPTHCYSGSYVPGMRVSHCPRCSKRQPREVLRDVLEAMERGMHAADPSAEFIAWPYSQYLCWGEDLTRDAAGHIPRGVILMHNFESAYRARQLGKVRRADDYWLAFPGPSTLFRDCARRARRQGTRMFAKLMVGCSHELASVPHIPVPGNIYRRFRKLHVLGVSGVLQNWSSGNDPSLMNRLAGQLAFAPLPSSEGACLEALARRDWGRRAHRVARAWDCFREAFSHYPLTIGFGYYGPMHNGPVWPLYLEPRNKKLGRNWTADPPGGDRIGDCIGYHTLDDVITLCRRMRDLWSRGVKELAPLDRVAAGHPERLEQLAVARALELHFQSGVNILMFYALREKLAGGARTRRMRVLNRMAELVRAELAVDRRLLPLVEAHPRLGYCPEARAYKYFPAMIRWRMQALRTLLAREFPRVRRRLAAGRPPFPHVTGPRRRGFVYPCQYLARRPPHRGAPDGAAWESLPGRELCRWRGGGDSGRRTTWRAGYDRYAIYFGFHCREPNMTGVRARHADPAELGGDDQIHIYVETSQFEPQHRFLVNAAGAREYFAHRGMGVIHPKAGQAYLADLSRPKYYRWTARARRGPDHWSLTVRIPFRSLNVSDPRSQPVRFMIQRHADLLERPEVQTLTDLRGATREPDDPLHFGWMVFE